MAKKLSNRERDKIEGDMWNMLVMANSGWEPKVLDADDGDIPGEVGVENWLNWLSAIRRRWLWQEFNDRFSCYSLKEFQEFPDAVEAVCEMLACKRENDAKKAATT